MSKNYIVYYNWMTDGLEIENWLQEVLDNENLELISFQDKMWVFRKVYLLVNNLQNSYGVNGSHWEGCEEVHWDCRIAQLEAELKITDELLKEATETIGAVVACCTYNSNDDAKIGIYGIDQKAFTRIDQFITHYNDAVSAGKVSVDVKRELSDAEIEELGAQEAERKELWKGLEE